MVWNIQKCIKKWKWDNFLEVKKIRMKKNFRWKKNLEKNPIFLSENESCLKL